jgi:hypothetical protein
VPTNDSPFWKGEYYATNIWYRFILQFKKPIL